MGDIFDVMAEANVGRIQELEGLILKARDAYYNNRNVSETGQQIVPDETYDAWVDELSELRVLSPAVTAVGAKPTSEWKKVRHEIQMGSLDKVNTFDELTKWFLGVHKGNKSEPVIVTEKLDAEGLDQIVARDGPLRVGAAVDYVLQACAAVAAM